MLKKRCSYLQRFFICYSSVIRSSTASRSWRFPVFTASSSSAQRRIFANSAALLKLFATPERMAEIRSLYVNGGAAYGYLKQELFELINGYSNIGFI